MNQQPSITKILSIDYLAFSMALIPPIMWCFYFILLYLREITISYTPILISLGIATISALAIISWRINRINTIFSDGIQVQGVVSNVFFFRDRGRVDFIFTYQNQKYSAGTAIHKVKLTQALYAGQPVTVMVDRNKPKNSIIRDLFI